MEYLIDVPRTPAPSPAGDTFGALVADVLRLMRADFQQRARSHSLPPQLHRLLLAVHRTPGCRQVELAERLDLSPVTVGRMLDRLEKQGLVRREAHPTDRRAARVSVDAKALPQVRRLAEFAQEAQERALEGMAPDERRAVMAALRQVRDNLLAARSESAKRQRRHG